MAKSQKAKKPTEDKAQFERFVETARALQADERPEMFDKLFAALAKPKVKRRKAS